MPSKRFEEVCRLAGAGKYAEAMALMPFGYHASAPHGVVKTWHFRSLPDPNYPEVHAEGNSAVQALQNALNKMRARLTPTENPAHGN